MTDASQVVKLVVAVFVAGLMGAFLLPVALGAVADDPTEQFNQTTGETVDLNPGLNSTLDSTTAGTSATYTVNYEGTTTSTTVNVGSNTTATVDGVDVTIAVSSAQSGYAVADYTYPKTAGWGSAGSLWGILPVILVLAIFLFMVGLALKRM